MSKKSVVINELMDCINLLGMVEDLDLNRDKENALTDFIQAEINEKINYLIPDYEEYDNEDE